MVNKCQRLFSLPSDKKSPSLSGWARGARCELLVRDVVVFARAGQGAATLAIGIRPGVEHPLAPEPVEVHVCAQVRALAVAFAQPAAVLAFGVVLAVIAIADVEAYAVHVIEDEVRHVVDDLLEHILFDLHEQLVILVPPER